MGNVLQLAVGLLDAVPARPSLGALPTRFTANGEFVDVGFKIQVTVIPVWILRFGVVALYNQVIEFCCDIDHFVYLVTGPDAKGRPALVKVKIDGTVIGPFFVSSPKVTQKIRSSHGYKDFPSKFLPFVRSHKILSHS